MMALMGKYSHADSFGSLVIMETPLSVYLMHVLQSSPLAWTLIGLCLYKQTTSHMSLCLSDVCFSPLMPSGEMMFNTFLQSNTDSVPFSVQPFKSSSNSHFVVVCQKHLDTTVFSHLPNNKLPFICSFYKQKVAEY